MKTTIKVLKVIVSVILLCVSMVLFTMDYTFFRVISVAVCMVIAIITGITGMYLLITSGMVLLNDDEEYRPSNKSSYLEEKSLEIYAKLGNDIINAFNDDEASDDAIDSNMRDLAYMASCKIDAIKYSKSRVKVFDHMTDQEVDDAIDDMASYGRGTRLDNLREAMSKGVN